MCRARGDDRNVQFWEGNYLRVGHAADQSGDTSDTDTLGPAVTVKRRDKSIEVRNIGTCASGKGTT
jgi:hypothetical protein